MVLSRVCVYVVVHMCVCVYACVCVQGTCVARVVSAPNSLDTISNPFGVGSYCACYSQWGGHDCTAPVFSFVRVNFLMEVGPPSGFLRVCM